MTRLHLLIDGLDDETVARHPHLAKLVARGRVDGPADAGYSAALARQFGVSVHNLPAIEQAAHHCDTGSGDWFRADPVHLHAGMHSLTLFDCRHTPLNDEESTVLINLLNQHFKGEIEFFSNRPMRWYARFSRPPVVEAAPLDQVAGRLVSPDIIAGPDARTLQRIGMEIQMLLHEHPINIRREENDLPSINSVWFWGGGGYRKPTAGYALVYAEDESASLLARAAGLTVTPMPARLSPASWSGDVLIVLNELAGQPDADHGWFQPILRGLQTRRITEVRLCLSGRTNHTVTNWNALSFWRKRPVSE
jgi:hypothetical protein